MKGQTTDRLIALLFWAEWHEPCHQLRDQLAEMSKVYSKIRCGWVNADEASDLVEKLDVSQVPTLALYHPHKAAPEIVENPSPERLT